MTLASNPSGGQFDGQLHRYGVRVYFEDTDAGGVVYHANYLRWFERARSDILRLLGIDQAAAMLAGEGTYVVAEAQLRYLSPARLGDVVTIETLCQSARSASVRLRQYAQRNDERLVEAHIRVGFVGPDGRPRRQPEAWRAAFASLVSETEG